MGLIKDTKTKKKANVVEQVANLINAKFGKVVCFTGTRASQVLEIRRASSGILGLDIALGGGFPNGFSQFWGIESAGKTTAVLRHIAICQQCDPDYTAAYVDVEHSLDPQWAQKCGVDLDRLMIIQPATAEQALDTVEELVNAKIDTIIVDSVAALSTKAEVNMTNEGNTMGGLPRALSKFFRKCTSSLQPDFEVSESKDKKKKVETLVVNFSRVIFINQAREKISTYGGGGEQYPGGRALRHFLKISVKTRRGDEIKGTSRSGVVGDMMEETSKKNKTSAKDASPVLGHYVHWFVDKNKTCAKMPVVRSILYVADSDQGEQGSYDHPRDLIRFGLMFGVFVKNKAVIVDDEDNKFVGIAKFRQFIDDNEEYYWRKYAQILKLAIGESKFEQIKVAGFKVKGFEESGRKLRKEGAGKKSARKWKSMA